ncbi:MAG: sulfite exporter TauE/SafE family protein [Candidatus Marinimicrobia bacterium]|nr:sulfite exporter TauE/SafE family protein [Candidatus Neomarinimicrobiota bacterium]MDP6835662.1 sulfite exporter TauE/SafE family protein [Candidatus Neomarinimicrobiota bacterium]|tara:strand:- start:1376 stop:2146 length:771 start_codon:yes stop_codon:yes gene_type:complete
MEYIIVSLVALLVSGLTLFSGFGLGSLLMPVMAIFFPMQVAIAATAVVHLANNFFKLSLFGKYRRGDVVVKFGMPAIVFAAAGAWILTRISGLPPVATYTWFARQFEVEWVKLMIAALIVIFALIEVLPMFRKLEFSVSLLPLGGVLSGLFGGLSGHQGAMRSAFLANTGLTKEQFIGTGVTIACMVDITRLTVYGVNFSILELENSKLVLAGSLAAFLGAYLGKRMVEKVTMIHIQRFVAISLIVLSIALGSGLI